VLKKIASIIDQNSFSHGLKNNRQYYEEKNSSTKFSNKASSTFDFLELINYWEEIIGKQNAKHTIPLRIQNHVLYILCNHSAYSMIMSYSQEEIKNRILKKFPQLRSQIKKISSQVDSTFFQERFDNFRSNSNRSNSKKCLENEELKKKSHKYSPHFKKLKGHAEKKFTHIDDEEIRNSLVSLFIQCSDQE
jgi:hypothetical protein